MKNLSSYIVEHMTAQSGEAVNEAFGSAIMSNVHKLIGSYSTKNLFASTALLWDKIEDENIQELFPDDINTLKQSEVDKSGDIIFWFVSKEGKSYGNYLGTTRGKDAIDFQSGMKNGRYVGKIFKTVTGAKKVASYAVRVVDSSSFANKQLKGERFSTKQGATAFMTNRKIAQENQARWAKILADKALETDKTFDEFAAKFTEVLKRTADTISASMIIQDWEVVDKLNRMLSRSIDKMETISRRFAEIDNYKAIGERTSWSEEWLKQEMKEVNDYIKMMEAYNNAE